MVWARSEEVPLCKISFGGGEHMIEPARPNADVRADQRFIAHAREDIPALIAESRTLEQVARVAEKDLADAEVEISQKDAEIVRLCRRVQRLREAIEGFTSWRAECHAYDDDMGHERRDFDEDELESLERHAQYILDNDMQVFGEAEPTTGGE